MAEPGLSTAARFDEAALSRTLREQGEAWHALVSERCPHLFAHVTVPVSASQMQQMRAVIAGVEEVVGHGERHAPLGVCYGYDFHLNPHGVHLIEVNTNAGGAFLNALLIASQRGTQGEGSSTAMDLEQTLLAMFRNEWRLARGDELLGVIAIVDEQPTSQYLYPEFLLAQRLFERNGLVAVIVDPAELHAREDGLYCRGQRIGLIYNRLTDFSLEKYPHLRSAWEMQQVVMTPDPQHHACYADKRKLATFSDAAALHRMHVSQASVDALLQGVPHTRIVLADEADFWWKQRKGWFFKPVSGYGSKGAYRGDKLTRRVFDEIMQSHYVAQRLAPPGELAVEVDGVAQTFKYDVRCYVYAGAVQFAAARLYQGQTTNFRTPGGGFARVQVTG